jgi:chemotaxis signal transduction protein
LRPGPRSRIAVAEVDGLAIGLAVDAALEILAVDAEALGDLPALVAHAGCEATRAVVRRPGAGPIAILSLEHVVETLYRAALPGAEAAP